MYYMIAPSHSDLYHHGILGQKWGKQNGPPYPLGSGDHSTSEKKAGWRKSLDKKTAKHLSKDLNTYATNYKKHSSWGNSATMYDSEVKQIINKHLKNKISFDDIKKSEEKVATLEDVLNAQIFDLYRNREEGLTKK